MFCAGASFFYCYLASTASEVSIPSVLEGPEQHNDYEHDHYTRKSANRDNDQRGYGEGGGAAIEIIETETPIETFDRLLDELLSNVYVALESEGPFDESLKAREALTDYVQRFIPVVGDVRTNAREATQSPPAPKGQSNGATQ
jgi:hypothetical protein